MFKKCKNYFSHKKMIYERIDFYVAIKFLLTVCAAAYLCKGCLKTFKQKL